MDIRGLFDAAASLVPVPGELGSGRKRRKIVARRVSRNLEKDPARNSNNRRTKLKGANFGPSVFLKKRNKRNFPLNRIILFGFYSQSPSF